jgi:para-aminobenzoate synthetase component 1
MDSNDYPISLQVLIVFLGRCFYFDKNNYHNAFEDLKQYQQTAKDWLLVIYRMI